MDPSTPIEIHNAWFLWTAIIPILFTLIGVRYSWKAWDKEGSGYETVGALFKTLMAIITVLLAWIVWGVFYSTIIMVSVGH